MTDLSEYGIIPVETDVIAESINEYKSTKDKISALERAGSLIRLKKGLYVVSNKLTNKLYSLELIANRLYGPSYVSFESALSYHGLIPERVYTVKSAIMQRAKHYATSLGNFEYIKVPESYYPIGQQHIIRGQEYAFLIATPEKAICDLILCTRGLRIQSTRAMVQYLLEDIRLDIEEHQWDITLLENLREHGYKRNELNFLIKVLSDG